MKRIKMILVSIVLGSLLFQGCAPTNVHLREARICLGRDDIQKAQKELALALEQQPNNVEAAFLEGHIYFKQENWAKMYESFVKVKSIDSLYEKENIEKMSLNAFAKLRGVGINEKFNKAVRLKQAEVVDAEQAEKLLNSSLVDLELANKLNKGDFFTNFIIGNIYIETGEKDKALEKFDEAIIYGEKEISVLEEEIKKLKVEPIDSIKTSYIEKKTNDKLSIRNSIITCYFHKHNIYKEKGMEDKAIESLNKIIEIDPNEVRAIKELAKHYEESEPEKALPLYEKVLATDPKNTDILFNQGNLYYKMKNIDSAIANFEKILAITPNDSETMYFLSMFYQEKAYQEVKKNADKGKIKAIYQKTVDMITPKWDGLSDEWKDKISDYIQIAIVNTGGGKKAADKYLRNN